MTAAENQILSAIKLCEKLKPLTVTELTIYNPLIYARKAYEEYVTRYGGSPKRVVFMGMNPGPWGMAQTGVPFGEVSTVKGWLGIKAPIYQPEVIHPKRPVLGYECTRSEVSGKRLWGLFKEKFVTPEAFFREHFVINYCPLLFTASSGSDGKGARNVTPDKLDPAKRDYIYSACGEHLTEVAESLKPDHLVALVNFAEERAR